MTNSNNCTPKLVIQPDCTTVKVSSVGIPGATGAQGIQGIQGIQGETGIQGADGLQGTQGLQGETGGTGTQGVQGLDGTQGIQGIQGESGITGAQGTKGTEGLQGIQGIQGSDSSVAGPQGVQGLTGEGPQGIQGSAGEAAAQGTQGIQGAEGIQGLAGEGTQGIQGTEGIQGIQGLDGIQGLTGEGIQGIQGTEGTQGTNGAQGIEGSQGIQGTAIQGIQGIQGPTAAAGGTDITVYDEGVSITAAASSFNFVGSAIQATNVGNAVTVAVDESMVDTQFLLDLGAEVANGGGTAFSGSAYLVLSGSNTSENTRPFASPSGVYGGEGVQGGINIWYLHRGYDTHITFYDSTVLADTNVTGERNDVYTAGPVPSSVVGPWTGPHNRIATLRKTGYYTFNLTTTGADGMLLTAGYSQYNSDPKIEDLRYTLDSVYGGKTQGNRVVITGNTNYSLDETYSRFDLHWNSAGYTITLDKGELPLGQVATVYIDYTNNGTSATLKYKKTSSGNPTEIATLGPGAGTLTLTVMGLNDGIFCFEHP